MKNPFRTRYRIVQRAGYHTKIYKVQVWRWYFPFWTNGYNSFSINSSVYSLKDAEDLVGMLLKPVVKLYD